MATTSPASSESSTASIIASHDQHMIVNLPRYPIAIARGLNAEMWDANGKHYIDLFAGFGAGVLGHCHPDLVQAVTEQASKLWHVGNLLHTEPQVKLAEAIHKHGFGGRSYFCHSGADANEAAIKLARLHGKATPGPRGKRFKVISAFHSFHGRSFSTMMATGQDKVRLGFEPWLEGFSHVPYNDLAAMEKAIDDQTVAIIVEPIQGEGGVNVPDAGYLAGLRQLADKHNLILIFDEVWTGCGRTGKYFAHQHWNITPDIMTLAKGVGGGLPVGVMCANEKAAAYFDYRKHGSVAQATTLGGNCLSMAVAAKVFEVLERDNLVAKSVELGNDAVKQIENYAKGNPMVAKVRGRGLFIGIELNPAAAKDGKGFNAAQMVQRCLDRGLLINGTQDVVLRLAPSLCIEKETLDKGLAILFDALTV